MILFYDVDNTLTNPIESSWNPDKAHDDWHDQHGKDWIMPPDPDRVADLRAFLREGHEIIIWSCRTNPIVMGMEDNDANRRMLIRKLKQWLDYYAIPYHRIEVTPKPFFTYLVDDRAANPAVDADLLLLRYSRMKRYVEHDDDCGAQKLLEPYEEDDLCTCGLSDLLNEDWAAGLKGSIRNGRPDL